MRVTPIALKISVAKGQRVLTGQDHYWKLMMDADMRNQPFSVDDIFDLSNNRGREQISTFLAMCEKAELITRTGDQNPRGMALFRIVARQSATPVFKRDGTLIADPMTARQALWNAMRSPFFRNGFKLIDISVHASTDSLTVAQRSARLYISCLLRAGYLTVLQKGTRLEPTIWRLVRNTGPIAPKLLKTECIYDPNAEKIFGEPETVEVQP
ncbi:hypothetical protein [Agrobacterium genomosp. 2]|uniref:Uncharacterized protein n=1 Tax=Agrobacterium genomosp. 2 str. CFBP 5494 TaxID=1183436 RepID=A0A9W5AYY8_9HYPH|nr:hypothetical protein [Agrobacterium genomosp. 2]CUW88018.1 conserved hypothetical protein [Agrobacterium genomosp. 2 str. CFBP 5494]